MLEGKAYRELAGWSDPGQEFFALLEPTADGALLRVCAPVAREDGKAHTYRLTLACAGKDFTYAVKTAAVKVPAITLKASGTINTLIPQSPAVLTATVKNANPADISYQLLRIEERSGKTLLNEDVSGLFAFSADGSRFTFTQNGGALLTKGHTYTAVIGADVDGDGMPEATAAAALKVTFPTAAPKIGLKVKAAGKLDFLRPGNAVTLTPTLTNCYREPERQELRFFEKVGKNTVEHAAEDSPFIVDGPDESGVYSVRIDPARIGAATSAWSVKLVYTIDGKEYLSPAVSLKVTKGKVTIAANAKTLTLMKEDRYSRGEIVLTIADKTAAGISRVELDAASAKKYQVVHLGGGRFAIEYIGNRLPILFKTTTLKLSVYTSSGTVPAGTVSLKVSFK